VLRVVVVVVVVASLYRIGKWTTTVKDGWVGRWRMEMDSDCVWMDMYTVAVPYEYTHIHAHEREGA
jgi:hypothetical protein